MAIARAIQQQIKDSSWIRRMFETGRVLKRQHGADKVCDFSLGSPRLEPPQAFVEALRELATTPPPGMHAYMPNNGFTSTRTAVAHALSQTEQVTVDADDVVMTVGAAGALNVAMTSILDPGDEVIILSPYFVEYLFYVVHHGGTPVIVETDDTFGIDLARIDAALGPRTKAIIINTPNNPTGRVYTQNEINRLCEHLQTGERTAGHAIFLVVDTPYAKLTFDGAKNPRFFAAHPSTLIAHSYSKELGLAGERIGFLAINPQAPDRVELRNASTITNRTLGFINAPAIMQLAVERALASTVDISHYCMLRDKLCTALTDIGYDLIIPQGTFYAFPKTPIPDDVAFTQALQDELVLVVPGTGFGRAGHVRVAFCVEERTIDQAIPSFKKAYDRVCSRK